MMEEEEGQEDGFQRAGGIQKFNLEQGGRGRPVESPPPLEVSWKEEGNRWDEQTRIKGRVEASGEEGSDLYAAISMSRAIFTLRRSWYSLR